VVSFDLNRDGKLTIKNTAYPTLKYLFVSMIEKQGDVQDRTYVVK
jgi:hypothetical protein